MAKGRHTLNPAKVKADVKAMEQIGRVPRGRLSLPLRGRVASVLMGLLTVALLTASFAPLNCWYLAYVALAPWALALLTSPTRRWAWLVGWLTGLVFWAASLYWLTWITLVGYAALVLYLSAHWWVAAAVLRAAWRRRWPMWIFLPVVWVALEYARAYVIGGFPWFFLAHTQYLQTRLIQIADITGVYGVSLLVAMVNGLVVDLLAGALLPPAEGEPGPKRLRPRLLRGAAVTGGLAAVLLGYGTWQLARRTQTDGPIIGIVQRAVPISLGGQGKTSEEVLEEHLQASSVFLGRDVDLVIWPETMVPRGLNADVLNAKVEQMPGVDLRALAARFFGPQVWDIDSDETIRYHLKLMIDGGTTSDGREVVGLRREAERITDLARKVKCPILAGGATVHPNPDPISPADRWVTRNSTIWFDPNGRPGPTYSKVHLVPFSEYVPFKRSWTWFYGLLRKFVPSVMEQLEPGTSYTHFTLTRPGGTWKLVTPVCYEGTFARVCRRMVYRDGRKDAGILANVSNDGWFVCPWGSGPLGGSFEQAQHLSQYCFRAVEGRVPVVRAVNTGISASIDSNGRIVAEVSHAGLRTMIPGTLLLDGARRNEVEYLAGHGPKVLVDSRQSWYSLHPDVLPLAAVLAAGASCLWLALKRPGGRGKE